MASQTEIANILSSIESNKQELEERCGFDCIEATIQELEKANGSPKSELNLWLTNPPPRIQKIAIIKIKPVPFRLQETKKEHFSY